MLLGTAKQRVFITICTWHLLHYSLIGAYARHNQRISRYRTALERSSAIDVKDKILEWQCLARFEEVPYKLLKQNSHEQCKKELLLAPRHGQCPNDDKIIQQYITPWQQLYCLNNCSHDHDCPDVQKCCASTCGMVCMPALGLDMDNLLPPIPKILRHKLPNGNWVELTIQTWANSSYFCHVEIRYHYGTVFSERMLSAWQWQPVKKIAEISDTRVKSTDIAFKLKTGRYYQVRVAAINEYGFRGYSQPSQVFTPRNEPKPPKEPTDLKVISAEFDGKYYKIKVAWCPSKSNLPVEKYKIFWSLYIPSKGGSFISNEAYVKDIHQYEIKDLMPDSFYYVQVQAMSINGERRLKSQKINIIVNTTTPMKAAPLRCIHQVHQRHRHMRINNHNNSNNHSNSIEKHAQPDEKFNASSNHTNAQTTLSTTTTTTTTIADALLANRTTPMYKARYRFNRKLGMITQISGFQPYKEKVYELCPIEPNCELREYNAIRVKKDSQEFSKLKFNTTYVLKAYNSDGDGYDNRGSYTFTTPKCENFRKSFPKMLIKC